MEEYYFENERIDSKPLISENMEKEDYINAHKNLPIACHDAFIQYENGILLVKRLNFPAKDLLWPIGGRIIRGKPIIDSLREKVKKEANLDLSDIKELGSSRTLFKTDPFGHGKGTDTINFAYFAKGKGTIKLDKLHENPIIITPEKYKDLREKLHPYVREFMDLAIALIR